MVVVKADAFNRSAIRTVVVVPLTSELKWAASPGNVELSSRDTGLPRRSVANVSQIVTLDREILAPAVGHIPVPKLELVLAGIGLVLGQRMTSAGEPYLRAVIPRDPGERATRFARALAAAGRFSSGTGDVSARHDEIAGEGEW